MLPRLIPDLPPQPPKKRPAVIDIGSNSVRLVVYESMGRSPTQIVNEKAMCGLGRQLETTGRLDPDGVASGLATLRRFKCLLDSMAVTEIAPVATAAVRDAEDGAQFLETVRREVGLDIRVISGEEEATLSALGVLAAEPSTDGLIGDMGGASLELVEIENGEIGPHLTLPVAPLRLAELGGRAAQVKRIDGCLESVPWLDRIKGRTFVAVGGAWRALARAHMAQSNYPLHVIHHYTVSRGEMQDFATVVAKQGKASIERVAGISRRRVDTLPAAALVMERICKLAKPKTVAFTAFGLREGVLYERLDPAVQRTDPLIAAAAEVALRIGRFGHAECLEAWTAPLFFALGEPPSERRLRAAACLLSDIGWTEHPDYRAFHAYQRVLRMPFGGIDHASRAGLALAIHGRYGGGTEAEGTEIARALVSSNQLKWAYLLGLVLRLGHTVTAGSVELLEHTRLALESHAIVLELGPAAENLAGEVVQRRLDPIARALNRPVAEIRVADRQAPAAAGG